MNRKEAGFTLIELVVTLVVLAITIVIAAPSFAGLLQRSRESGTYHLLTTSLAGARMRAIRDSAPVTVCPSADGRSCRADGIWTDGWIIYRDPERGDQPASEAAVVQQFDGLKSGLRLRGTNGRRRVRFLPSGWAYGSNISIRLCDSEHLLGNIVVNTGGRPRVSRQTGPAICPFGTGSHEKGPV